MARSLATYGIYPSIAALHTGAEALKAQGFRQTDISLLYSDRPGTRAFEVFTMSDGAAAGVATGATLGVILGYLAGIGAITLPGIGPLLAAGPLVGALASVGAGGATGGLIGTLVELGIPEYDAARYEGRLKDGSILLSVYCDDSTWAGRAKNILMQTGAEHVAAAAEKEA